MLSNIYFNIKNPASFKSALNLYQEAKKVIPNITYKDVKEWLINQETYTVHHRTIRNFKRSFMVSRKIDENWQTDLVEIEHPENNDGYRYLLTVIDVLSKYGWIQPLYDKNPQSIKKAFQIILKSKRKPKILTSDAGTEFVGFTFQNFLKKYKIKHFIARNTEVKAAVVERFNRTIKENIYHYMYHYDTKRFINIIQDIVKNYNSTTHSRTKFKPSDVTKDNEHLVYTNLYKNKDYQIRQLFNQGDTVRIQKVKGVFEKGYKPNWSTELFRIKKVLNTIPTRFIIEDLSGEELIGSFYQQELLKIYNG